MQTLRSSLYDRRIVSKSKTGRISMKIRVVGKLEKVELEGLYFRIQLGEGPFARVIKLPIGASGKYDFEMPEPIKWEPALPEPPKSVSGNPCSEFGIGRGSAIPHRIKRLSDPLEPAPCGETSDGIWVFRRHVVSVCGSDALPEREVKLRIKHAVLREEKALARMARELEAFENMERLPDARRERIPDSVRLFVWQRDEGKCVRCGSSEKLEFDHIIPVSKGGANTERNIQLLCEACNRAKGASI
jgi:hypothetical protein